MGVLELSVDKEAAVEKRISYSFGLSRDKVKPMWVGKVLFDA